MRFMCGKCMKEFSFMWIILILILKGTVSWKNDNHFQNAHDWLILLSHRNLSCHLFIRSVFLLPGHLKIDWLWMQKQLALKFAEVIVTLLVSFSSLPFTIEFLAAFSYASRSLQTTHGGHEFPRAFSFKRLFFSAPVSYNLSSHC